MSEEQKSIRELIAIPIMCQSVHLAKHTLLAMQRAQSVVRGCVCGVQNKLPEIIHGIYLLDRRLHWPSIDAGLVRRTNGTDDPCDQSN